MNDASLADVDARRLRMRSWRRGLREMDLILGAYADAEVGRMDMSERRAYAELLEQNDQTLFAWVIGSERAPRDHRPMLARIRAFHGIGRAGRAPEGE